MSGWITNGVPNLVQTTGTEQSSFDTFSVGGSNPLTGSINIFQLANMISFYGNGLDKI